jgi:predicted N-acetyltransferase YhbS
MVEIREERENDREAIGRINEQAFGQPTEANIVDALRASCPAPATWHRFGAGPNRNRGA